MPKRGENIYKRKDGRWEGRYIKSASNGTVKWGYVYAKSYKEVNKADCFEDGRLISVRQKDSRLFLFANEILGE